MKITLKMNMINVLTYTHDTHIMSIICDYVYIIAIVIILLLLL
jgi:hypothetical protein